MATAWDAWPSASYPPPSTVLPGRSLGIDRSNSLTARLAALVRANERRPQWVPPMLPPEVLRRIIRTALELPPSVPRPIAADMNLPSPMALAPSRGLLEDGDAGPPWKPPPGWDAFAGRAAVRERTQRVAMRAEVARTARSMMAVCRSWKAFVARYLYTEPVITSDNIALLASVVVAGDRKWSDLHLHPHSSPGRWLTVLDLSKLETFSYFGADTLGVARALGSLLDLAPEVTHLRLPPSGVRLEDLQHAPCARRLRALEGVYICSSAREEEVLTLLRYVRNLELLGLVYTARGDEDVLAVDTLSLAPTEAGPEPTPATLDKLHTLTVVNALPGPLLAGLTRARLPNLTRLVLTPYPSTLLAFEDDPVLGGARALQRAHGTKIRSLTYAATPVWPPDAPLPALDTLSLHPNLLHLHLALPHATLSAHPELALELANPSHPLSAITIPRWPRVQPDSDSAPLTEGEERDEWDAPPKGNAFLSSLLARPSRLKSVAVDGFTWVHPGLGRWATESGDNGMLRRWAAWMARRGVWLLDMDGGMPLADTRRGSDARRASLEGWRMSIGLGRRSSEYGCVGGVGMVRRESGSDENDGG